QLAYCGSAELRRKRRVGRGHLLPPLDDLSPRRDLAGHDSVSAPAASNVLELELQFTKPGERLAEGRVPFVGGKRDVSTDLGPALRFLALNFRDRFRPFGCREREHQPVKLGR